MSDRVSGQTVSFNQTGTLQVKNGPGRVCMVSVHSAVAVVLHDSATTGGVGAGNLLASLPAVIGTYLVDMPFYNGLVIVAGAGIASVSYV